MVAKALARAAARPAVPAISIPVRYSATVNAAIAISASSRADASMAPHRENVYVSTGHPSRDRTRRKGIHVAGRLPTHVVTQTGTARSAAAVNVVRHHAGELIRSTGSYGSDSVVFSCATASLTSTTNRGPASLRCSAQIDRREVRRQRDPLEVTVSVRDRKPLS